MMKRSGHVLISLVVFAMLLVLTTPASADFLQDGTGLVSMEAEHYQANVPLGNYAWTSVTKAGSSGTGALQALPDDGPSPLSAGAGPRMDYQAQFTRTGIHYVWIRALANSTASDSLYVGLDGGTTGAVYMTGLNVDGVTWKWSKQKSGGIATINVTSLGLHTINVWMRESGVVLDKLVLTTSSSYTPTGTGPAETVGSTTGIPPTVATNAATSVTETGGTVNGGVNPNGLATTPWFEWGTDPSLATFSVTTNQSLGSGTSSQAVNAALSGLSSGTPYYFRVAASSSGGTTKGSISSFSTITGSGPNPFLQNSTGLVSMEAEHYQGNIPLGNYAWVPVANPGSSGTGALQALPDDTPSSLVAGAGPRLDYQVQFTRTGTHYIWIRALAHSGGSDSLYVGLDGGTAGAVYMTGLNWDGVTWKWSKQKSGGIATINVTSLGLHTINVWMRESGVVLDKLVLTTSSSYTPTGTGPAETVGSTTDLPPTVATNAATSVTESGATVNGGVNPNGLATTAWFEWGTDPSLATFSVTTNQSLGSGTSSQAVNAALSGLSTGTPFYFRVVASNSMGTSKGSIGSFSTTSGAASDPFLQDGTGLVSMEAEHYQTNVPKGSYSWTPVTKTGSSGTGALQALPDDGPSPLSAGAGPRMDYQVQFTRTGTHYVWIRALAHSGASDSLYVGLDGGTTGALYMTGLNVDGVTWTWSKKKSGGIATINVTSPGLHTINVWMRESGVVLDKLVLTTSSSYTPTGTGPAETVDFQYVAMGDSITRGSHDDISADGIGYEPILGNLLTGSKGYTIAIANEGVSGTGSADGVVSVSSILSKYPSAKYYLVMYGSNDSYNDNTTAAVPSGAGKFPGDPGYAGSYKDNMQQIISAIVGAGKTPYLAEVPYTTYPNFSDSSIQEFNVAIDELVLTNNILVVPPAFYAYFKAHQGELADGLHPNGTGYQSMANQWFNALTQ